MRYRVIYAAVILSVIPGLAQAFEVDGPRATQYRPAPHKTYDMHFQVTPVDSFEERMSVQGIAEVENIMSGPVSTFAGVTVLKTVKPTADFGVNPNDDVRYDSISALAGLRFRW